MVSGLKINLFKSSLLGVSVDYSEVIIIASITGCAEVLSLFRNFGYLWVGLWIGLEFGMKSLINFVIDNILGKLNCFLLMAASRLSNRGVLGSLGIYLFLIFRLPTTICHLLESCRAWFFRV